MIHSASSVPQLRKLLRQALPGDSDLEAFCIDYFPDVYRRFSLGMDRQAKLSLLLLYAEPHRIRAALAAVMRCETASTIRPSVLLQDNGIDSASRASVDPLAALPFSNAPYRPLRLLGLSTLALVFVGITIYTIHDHRDAPRTAVASVVLRSTPPGAEVWDLRKGRALGTTPLFIDPSLPPVAVCLRSPGFHDEVLSLAHGQIPQTAVALRPVGSDPSEVCDVPIPILP